MVVRGEDIEEIESSSCPCVDLNRKFPVEFRECDGGMSEIAGLCKNAGLHELFMMSMKKYNGH